MKDGNLLGEGTTLEIFIDRDNRAGGVNISARSLGAVNVQVIMESLGGGGHQTMAAAQLKHITPEAAHSRIQTAIDQYREAQKKSGLESESEQKKKDKQ